MIPKVLSSGLFLGNYLTIVSIMKNLDEIDRRLLRIIQEDAELSLDAISDNVGLSRNACWRRIKTLENSGVIARRVTLLDAEKLGLTLMVFILVRTNEHSPEWLDRFRRATRSIPEILSVYRMTGDLDYLIRARVSDMAEYDRIYQKLTQQVALADVSASFVMEHIKESHVLPV